MLNPSTADGYKDDPTVKKCCDYAKAWEYGGIDIVNLYAFRATDPKQLATISDPIGPENESYLRQAIMENRITILAWGRHGLERSRWFFENVLMRYKFFYLKINQDGTPSHPLYLKKNLLATPWASEMSL